MNNMIKTLATGVALATLFSASVHAAFVPYTIAELRRDYPDLKPGFNDESLLETARIDSALQMERDLHLRARWTGDEYSRAEASERLTRIRLDYQVGPNFTRDQLVEAGAARTLNRFISNHGLSAHFTQSELILAEGRKTAVEYGFKGQIEPGEPENTRRLRAKPLTRRISATGTCPSTGVSKSCAPISDPRKRSDTQAFRDSRRA